MPRDFAAEYRERAELLSSLAGALEDATKSALEPLQHIDRVAFRVKDAVSFARKCEDAQHGYVDPLREVEDQVAGRVLVFFRNDLELVRSALQELFGTIEHVRKEPEHDSSFGYESDHYIFLIPVQHQPAGWGDRDDLPQTFEMQIRTLFMHAWAEPQHDLGYKATGELSREDKRELAWAAASAWGADKAMNAVHVRLADNDADDIPA